VGFVRVLVVEDFEVLARSIGTGLRREGMAVDVVFNGTHALANLAVTRYDVVILDRDLPGVPGDDICRQLAADGTSSRILMLTAASAVKDRVDGLGLGARDQARRLSADRAPGWRDRAPVHPARL